MEKNGDEGPSDRLECLFARIDAEVAGGSLSRSVWAIFRKDIRQAALDLAQAVTSVSAAEGEHKMGNLMEGMLLMAADVRTSTPGPEEFIAELHRRLTLFVKSAAGTAAADSGPVAVRSLLERAVEAVAADSRPGSLRLQGPDIEVEGSEALALRLAALELATNAFKHGALREKGDTVDVSWHRSATAGGTRLSLSWKEICIRPLPGITREGSGSALLGSRLKDISGVDLVQSFGPHGLTVGMTFPEVPPVNRQDSNPAAEPRRCLLIVDDTVYILDGLALVFKAAGYDVLSAASEAAALALLTDTTPDAAVLDHKLGRGHSFGIADVLKGLNVPLLFLSGASSLEEREKGNYADAVWLTKPVDSGKLRSAVAALIDGS
jgi:two-component sensor histidine kinase/CheY-like chemotaxis protein